MKNNKSSLIIGVIGVIIFTVTLSIFFLSDFEKTNASWMALCFVVLSEIALVAGSIYLSNLEASAKKVFITSGLLVLLFLYFFTSVILALFTGRFKGKINNFAILQIIILVIVLIAAVLIIVFSQKINKIDQTVINNRRPMEFCQMRVYKLLTDNKNQKYKNQINSIYEGIRYCDKTQPASMDEKIVLKIGDLEKAVETEECTEMYIKNIIGEISALLKQRKMELELLKRGGF